MAIAGCRGGAEMHVAGGDRLARPVGQRSTKRPLLVDASRNVPRELAVADRARDRLAEPGGARRASGADRGEARARGPIAPAAPSWRPTAPRTGSPAMHADAGGGKIGRRIRQCRPDGCTQLTPMPITTRAPSGALAPRAGCRRACAVEQDIVRPFQRERAPRAPGMRPATASCTRERRDERQLAAALRRRTDRSAAGSRRDCPARDTQAGRAGRGRRSARAPTIQSGPRSPARARASASALVEPIVVVARRAATPAAAARGIELHRQNSDFAAAAAASTSGAGIDEEQQVEQAGDAEHRPSARPASARSPAPARRNT